MSPLEAHGSQQHDVPDPNSSRRRRTLWQTSRHYLPDLVYGANDGIVTTFVVVSGVTGAALSAQIILILGFANLLADGFSMGASNYLSKRSLPEDEGQVSRREGIEHGASTILAFVLAGSVPLIAYLVPIPLTYRLSVAVVLTLVALFVVGAARALINKRSWWRNGAEMLLVGAVAAAVAYVIGALLALILAGPATTEPRF